MSAFDRRPPRSVDSLEPGERERLERAHRRLRQTVEDDGPLHRDAARSEIRDAESALWQIRGELLGWARPAWAPNATLVADWFSDEDRIYDEV